jgi:hypothetical protein
VCCSWIFIRVKIGSKMEHVVFRSCWSAVHRCTDDS